MSVYRYDKKCKDADSLLDNTWTEILIEVWEEIKFTWTSAGRFVVLIPGSVIPPKCATVSLSISSVEPGCSYSCVRESQAIVLNILVPWPDSALSSFGGIVPTQRLLASPYDPVLMILV
ncbi:hypothetical protein J6590_017670 [Homalodisca vitripennis]|nr:hypothetical protein J6590_017670 [Homalodisca vitripennis]